jgi:AraC family transcriptional regulator
MTPKEWRKGGYKEYSKAILEQSLKAKYSTAKFDDLVPKIEKIKEFQSHYIRHKGYNAGIKTTWQKIETWRLSHDITTYEYIALFHDNPTITPLSECQYVACIKYDAKELDAHEELPKFKISGGIYAKFELRGESGDLLKFFHWVYHEWLVKNGYETTTKPPFVVYKKSHYLSDENEFLIDFYISIKY